MSEVHQRQVVLDTETTGMNQDVGPHWEGHRIIEIGCVEVINRRLTGRHFHVYLQPDRPVDPEAFEVHGISDDFLKDKPRFGEVAQDFIEFIRGAELVIHNAPFDIGFMDFEFRMWNPQQPSTETFCSVTDSLVLARRMFPGKRNNLDVLCDRFFIDNSGRTLHGALLDAEILADVYLAMTGGQTKLNLVASGGDGSDTGGNEIRRLALAADALPVIRASGEELQAHEGRLDLVEKKGGHCLWRQ
ncbi:DNA polymerase III subunit epsilon [Gallaecimonas mangrovi]|uniref:DNA polymerase III subunit epsilon n=1 Tax=Gallaecimonas mangrovi TaxID=2291597 RepID=UPI000E1FF1BA|nr:DNA polymerase III subunit epsilon [Gallaecimonas mangrovi]